MTADRSRDSRDHGSGKGRGSAFGLSRRRLLAGLGGIGAIGAGSGAGTAAYFTDAASLTDNEVGAGEVTFLVDGDPAPSGTLSFSVAGIDRGDSRTERYEIEVVDNPARLWLAAECPAPGDRLADALELNVRANGESVTVGWRTLAVALRRLVDGERIDDGCLEPNESIDLEIAWRLPDGVDDSFANSSASLTLRLYTEQCRHVSEAAAEHSNPFAGRVCDEPENPDCALCEDENGTKIGSLTFEYLGLETAEIVAAATGGGAGGVGNGGTVVFDGTVDPARTFTVDAGPIDVAGTDGNWIGPNLYVDDGSGPSGSGNSDKPDGVKIHTSCSKPLVPGMVFGNFELVSGTTVDGEQLCDPADGIEDDPHDPDPDKPDDPGKPDKPSKPDNPGKPDKPSKPDNPGKPGKPDNPGKPDDSGRPNDPDGSGQEEL